ncbi:hypothetical protein FKP32DRAFT_1611042 [Trametes sanguinea]|nr:hypothetical protein FKP32DRAFT_1611042 [Trametes sanguinea]
MSSMQETPAELISDFKSTSWLGWEYIITLDREISLVWTRKLNGASVIFFLNRYIMLVQFAVQLPLSFSISDEVRAPKAEAFSPARIISLTLTHHCRPFSALRAYAMSNRTWPVAVAVFLLSVAAACYNIVSPIHVTTLMHEVWLFSGTTATRICLIVADALVIGVTWLRTYRFRKTATEANVKTSFLRLLLRDGAYMYLIPL